MRKTLKKDNLVQRPASRAILALTLSASLAAFGCTTNQNRTNGEPVTAPAVGPTSPSSSSTPGSASNGLSEPPLAPMTSSFTRAESLPQPMTSSSRADVAAAIMAQHQPLQGRVLGPANPGSSGRGYFSDGRTGVFINPAVVTNPQVTVNSSISSPATPAIISGAGGGGGVVVNGAVVATSVNGSTGLTSGATTAAATTAGTSTVANDASGVVFPATAHPITPTNAALPLSAGVFSGGTGAVAAQTTSGGLGVTNALATPVNGVVANQTTVTNTGSTAVLSQPANNTINTFPADAKATTAGFANSAAGSTLAANTRIRGLANSATAAASTNGTAATSTSSVRVMRTNGRVVISNQ
jgi:hypothetical protein